MNGDYPGVIYSQCEANRKEISDRYVTKEELHHVRGELMQMLESRSHLIRFDISQLIDEKLKAIEEKIENKLDRIDANNSKAFDAINKQYIVILGNQTKSQDSYVNLYRSVIIILVIFAVCVVSVLIGVNIDPGWFIP
jgi:CHASE3 domain sensor protein